jgi:Cu+-exporting ATPase
MKTLTLPVEGMTCASCVVRIEKALNKADGVNNAVVNLAAEKVTFSFDERATDVSKLAAVVEDAGYKLITPGPAPDESALGDTENSLKTAEDIHHKEYYKQLKSEFIFALVMTIPIMFISMVEMTTWFQKLVPVPMDYIYKLLFLAASPVMFISGKRFFITTWKLLKHL